MGVFVGQIKHRMAVIRKGQDQCFALLGWMGLAFLQQHLPGHARMYQQAILAQAENLVLGPALQGFDPLTFQPFGPSLGIGQGNVRGVDVNRFNLLV